MSDYVKISNIKGKLGRVKFRYSKKDMFVFYLTCACLSLLRVFLFWNYSFWDYFRKFLIKYSA